MSSQDLRPRAVCQGLLAALEATEGRRRRRKRDTTPDAIGIAIKRGLLESAVREDPDPERFEQWLLDYCTRAGSGNSPGSVAAMARSVLEEWRLARSMDAFKAWLDRGAPSDDLAGGKKPMTEFDGSLKP